MSKKSEKKKSNQAKPKSATVKTVNQPKPEEPKPPAAAATNTAVNLCDDCAYEFGECEGIPKFASEADPTLKGTEADRVVECKGFRNVQDMPTADKGAADAEEPAAEEPDKPELVHAQEEPGATEEAKAADVAVMEADLDERRRKIQRFQREEDFGKCPACDRPLKRTAFNRDRDAVRCTNPRCRQYRAVVRQVKAE